MNEKGQLGDGQKSGLLHILYILYIQGAITLVHIPTLYVAVIYLVFHCREDRKYRYREREEKRERERLPL